MPPRLASALCRAHAGLLCVLRLKLARRARWNLAHCLPDSNPAEREGLLRQALYHRCLGLFDAARQLRQPLSVSVGSVKQVHGWRILEEAQAAGRGVVVLVPHFGNWELVGLYLSYRLDNTAILFKSTGDAELDAWITEQRARAGAEVLPGSQRTLKRLLARLRAGACVGILPDQRPSRGRGRMAPFFGHPALTMTLACRLLQATGARAVFAACARRADGCGFDLHLQQPDPGLYAGDLDRSLAVLNRGVEQVARLDLAQYQWAYHRFPGGGE